MIAVMLLTPFDYSSQFKDLELLSYSTTQAFTSSVVSLVFAAFRQFLVGVQLRVP